MSTIVDLSGVTGFICSYVVPSIAPSPVGVLVPDLRACQVAPRPVRPVDGSIVATNDRTRRKISRLKQHQHQLLQQWRQQQEPPLRQHPLAAVISTPPPLPTTPATSAPAAPAPAGQQATVGELCATHTKKTHANGERPSPILPRGGAGGDDDRTAEKDTKHQNSIKSWTPTHIFFALMNGTGIL